MTNDKPVINALLHPNRDVREGTMRVSEIIQQLVPLFLPGTRVTVFARVPNEPHRAFFATTEDNPDNMLGALRAHLKSTATVRAQT